MMRKYIVIEKDLMPLYKKTILNK